MYANHVETYSGLIDYGMNICRLTPLLELGLDLIDQKDDLDYFLKHKIKQNYKECGQPNH